MNTYMTLFNINAALTLPHITPVMGGRQQCPSGYTFGPVVRQYYIIEYVLRGKGVYTASGRSYPVQAGEAFIIRPYEIHLLQADKETPWEYVWIGFSTDLKLPVQLADNYVIDAAPIREEFLRLYAQGGENLKLSEYAALIFSMFAKLYVAEDAALSPAGNSMDTAVAIIHKEFASITVGALAARLFLDRSYFGMQFKKHTGKTPKEYIDALRLSSAIKLMEEFGYTITQAATAVGYSDVMAFSKMFKRHYGKSPRSFLKSKSTPSKKSTFHLQ